MAASERGRAVVIGASMAGLLAARVLSEHFGEVVVVERDRLPDGPEFRNGVPQSRHAHALLRSGLEVLDRLFPGFSADLEAAGAVRLEPPRDLPWLNSAGWSGRFSAGVLVLSSSRELTESLVRDRLRATPNVAFRTRSEVIGLTAAQDRATGVLIRDRDGSRPDSVPATALTADMVVEASGRMSKVPDWLDQLGFERPRQTMINSHLGYASRVFRPARRFDWKGLLIGATPDSPTGGGVFPLEGDRWMVTLGGYGRSHQPPIDEAGYRDFIRNLKTPVLFQALREAEPLGPIYGYARTENVRRHYEQLSQRLDRLVVVGDAACCFNPIYGQGMSVAGSEALALDACLRKPAGGGSLDGITASAQKAIASAGNDAWLMATGEDLKYPTTEGGREGTSRIERTIQRYIQRVLLRSNHDVVVCRAFTRVAHLLDPPSALFKPNVVVRVLAGRGAAASQEPPSS
jgi:2-polyprenyl-6-methoxyphenol hydroxylase-like FAD-dependent oxidoreductase